MHSRWIVHSLSFADIIAMPPEQFIDAHATPNFGSREEAISFALQKAREQNRAVHVQGFTTAMDMPLWRLAIGKAPKDTWLRVHPDGRVEKLPDDPTRRG